MNTPANVDLIEKNAEMAFQSGDMTSAERLFQQLLSIEPNQTRALNFFAMKAIAKGDFEDATKLFEKAIASKQKVAIVFANYAKLLRMQNKNIHALHMLDEALKVDPNIFALHFEKASIYEAISQHKNAALAYQNGLVLMPESVKHHPSLKDKIAHAYTVTQENQKQLSVFLEARLGVAESFRADRRYERFSECLDLIVGRRKAYIQKPQMINFPQLPAIPFFNRNDFEWAPEVESYFGKILAELKDVVTNDDDGFIPYVHSEPGKDPGVFGPLCDNLEWGAYFLVNQGKVIKTHCDRCPATLEALGKAPQVIIRNRGPTSFFSSLKPNTHIPAHHGATNTRLTVHLPMIVPTDCALRVGNYMRTWNPGELMIFDDTIEHEAWNGSDQRRIVLIFDIWNPLLTAVERELVATTVEGIVDYYGADAPMGEL